MTNPIGPMIDGAQTGLGIATAAPNGFMTIYALIAIVSFGIIMKDSVAQGGIDAKRELVKHFFSLLLIWVFFGYASTTTTTLQNTSSYPSENHNPQTVSGVPVGLSAAIVVCDTITGYLNTALKAAVQAKLGTDISNMPAAAERYKMNMAQAVGQLQASSAQNAQAINFYQQWCIDPQKINANPPKKNYEMFNSQYQHAGVAALGTTETPIDLNGNVSLYSQCSQLSTQLSSSMQAQNQAAANKNNVSVDDLATQAMNDLPVGAVGRGAAAAALNILSLISQIAAYLYANCIPLFLNILTTMYFAMYPVVLAMAMMPGQWTKLITYIEGYLWLSIIPVIIHAVDGATFGMGHTGLGGSELFSLNSALIDLAKIAIVLSAPALAAFLLFGHRPHSFTGLSGLAGGIAGGIAGAAFLAGRATKSATNSVANKMKDTGENTAQTGATRGRSHGGADSREAVQPIHAGALNRAEQIDGAGGENPAGARGGVTQEGAMAGLPERGNENTSSPAAVATKGAGTPAETPGSTDPGTTVASAEVSAAHAAGGQSADVAGTTASTGISESADAVAAANDSASREGVQPGTIRSESTTTTASNVGSASTEGSPSAALTAANESARSSSQGTGGIPGNVTTSGSQSQSIDSSGANTRMMDSDAAGSGEKGSSKSGSNRKPGWVYQQANNHQQQTMDNSIGNGSNSGGQGIRPGGDQVANSVTNSMRTEAGHAKKAAADKIMRTPEPAEEEKRGEGAEQASGGVTRAE